MSALEIFKFNENPVTIIIGEDGGFNFVASEVCKCLDISNHRQACSKLDDDEKGVI